MSSEKIKFLFVTDPLEEGKATLYWLYWALDVHIQTLRVSMKSHDRMIIACSRNVVVASEKLKRYISSMTFREVF